jgi:hypothetical protein
MKFSGTIDTNFANIRLFSHNVSFIFNKLLPSLNKTLYNSVVKLSVCTSERITETLFQFVCICKMASIYFFLYRDKQVAVRGCQVWDVSRMEKNILSHFCDCLTSAQASVRLGIVVKEKDVCNVSVRPNCTDALSHFV